ncbi:M20 family metallopeptidase [Thermoproteota archaeon]
MDNELREKVIECVDEEILIDLLKGMLRIPSFQGEETDLAKYIANWMEKRGIEVELQEVEEDRLQPIGRLRGTGKGPVLVYNGHIDIDAIFEGSKKNPFEPFILEIDGERRVYCQGLTNMKGGVAAFLVAGDSIKRASAKHKIELKGDLILTPVVGETHGGMGTNHLLTTYFPKHGIWPDMAVVTEPSGHKLITSHVGNVGIQINVYGESDHVSRKEQTVDALPKMIKVVKAIEEKFKFTYEHDPNFPEGPKFLISTMVCGRRRIMMKAPKHYFDLRSGAFNADQGIIVVDTRTVCGQTPKSVKADFEKVLIDLKKEDPQLDYEIKTPVDKKFETHRIHGLYYDVPTKEDVVQTLRQAFKHVWGKEPDVIGNDIPPKYPYNDVGYFWEAGIPGVMHGPGREQKEIPKTFSDMLHGSPPKYITLEEIIGCTKVLTLTALDVLTRTSK